MIMPYNPRPESLIHVYKLFTIAQPQSFNTNSSDTSLLLCLIKLYNMSII